MPEMLHLHAGCEQMIQLPLSFDAAIFQHDNMVGASQHCAAMRDLWWLLGTSVRESDGFALGFFLFLGAVAFTDQRT